MTSWSSPAVAAAGGARDHGSGGNGGNAGNADFSGQPGSDAYHLDTDNAHGRGGGGGTATAGGRGGERGCGNPFQDRPCAQHGNVGSYAIGGNGITADPGSTDSLSAGGAGGGGWYGGGGGGSGRWPLGGGGGGAGSSYVTPAAHASEISTAQTRSPSVKVMTLPLPKTTATLSGTTSGNDWYTAAVTVTLAASAHPDLAVEKTFYALDNPFCSPSNLIACRLYTGPFTVSSAGLHTLTYFSLNVARLFEDAQTRSFVLMPGVSAGSVASGTNPTATTSGAGGSITVTGSGSGAVGAAVYTTNPAGATTFNSSGAYFDVIAAGSGSGLTSLTIKNCNLNGGTSVSWYNGTTWVLVSPQTYDPVTKCVTITVTNTSSPNLSQLTGTVFGAGSPPTITAEAKTADGKPYTAGTWTNQSVKVTFKCSANATASAEVPLAGEGQNQSAPGTCTDGVGQKATTIFTGINIDKTPPTCAVRVSPTVLWAPDSKLVAITGTAAVGDNLSGVASVVGGSVTGNESLPPGDVKGFAINTAFGAPLRLSADVAITGQLRATRNPSGSGRVYSQTVTVKDQAGNTNATPCRWTVTVPHDQAPGQ